MAKSKENSIIKKFKKFDLGAIICFMLITLYCLIVIYMLYFAVITSLKDKYDFALDHNVFGFPNSAKYPVDGANFLYALENMKVQIKGRIYAPVQAMFIYGLIYSLGSTLANIFSKTLCAYFCAKYRTPLGKILYVIAVVTMILPTVGTMAATIQLMRSLGHYDQLFGVVFYNASYTGTYFLVFYAAFKQIPNAYSEAAKLDGAGHFTILFRIHIPMVAPSMFAVGIMQFIAFWNDYQVPMIYLPSLPTISYALFRYSRSSWADNAPALLAASLIVCVPVIIFFTVFKNKIMGNVTAGGLKG
jgi:ABC-type glycerol-3-phosphate transport system permease component